MEEVKKSINDKLSDAQTSLAEINKKEETVKNFAEKIAQRETQIENQTTLTKNYEASLKKFETNREQASKNFTDYAREKKQEIEQIIDDATEALGLGNAQGLSREFQTKADTLKPSFGFKLQPFKTTTTNKNNQGKDSSKSNTATSWQTPIIFSGNGANWWLIASGIFVFSAVGLSIWLLLDGTASPSEKNIWLQIVGRISMIGLLVTAAVFSAKQFTKASRLFEDLSLIHI